MRYVFLPGLDGTGFLFEPIVRLLESRTSALVLSYPDRFMDYSTLETVMRPQLPLDEPYLLIAESFGGPLAIRMAAQHPPMLRGLVLSATFVRKPRGRWGALAECLVGPYLFKRGWLESVYARIMKWQGLNRQQIALLLRALEHAPREVLAARMKEALEVDAFADLTQVEVPVLCLYAKRDLLIERNSPLSILKGNRNVRVVGLDTPHFLLQVKPDEALREIESFVSQLKAPA